MDLPTEEADEATVHVDVGRKLPEPTPEKMPESVVETNSDTAEMAPSSSVAKRKAKSTASSGNEARLKLKENQHKCPHCDKKMSVHALLYTHLKIAQVYHYQYGLQNFEVCLRQTRPKRSNQHMKNQKLTLPSLIGHLPYHFTHILPGRVLKRQTANVYYTCNSWRTRFNIYAVCLFRRCSSDECKVYIC